MAETSVYQPYVNPVALEAATWRFGDDALASAHGTSAVVSGADPSASVSQSMDTPPATKPNPISVGNVLDYFLLDVVGNKGEKAGSSSPWYERYSTILWSVLLVVLGLLLFSRGLGLIGEESASTVLSIEDPAKYPGIGHAIQRMKKRKSA